MRAEHEYTKRTKRSWCLWIADGTLFWVLAFVLANAIPAFMAILGITASVFIAWVTFGLPSVLWLHLYWKQQFSSKKMTALAMLNWAIIVGTIFINVAGMWTSIRLLLRFSKRSGADVFMCNDTG